MQKTNDKIHTDHNNQRIKQQQTALKIKFEVRSKGLYKNTVNTFQTFALCCIEESKSHRFRVLNYRIYISLFKSLTGISQVFI